MELALTIFLLSMAGGAMLWRAPRRSLSIIMALFVAAVSLGGYALYRPSLDLELTLETPLVSTDDGYRSSDNCASCHPREYESWHRTFHRTMTQRATPETVFADFNDQTLESWGRRYGLEREGDRFFVNMVDPDWDFDTHNGLRPVDPDIAPPTVRSRVVMITGSHHMQTFWVPSANGRALRNLPFVWMNEERRWLPREAVFLRHPRYGRMVPEWNSNCLKCHATRPRPGFNLKTGSIDTAVAELGIACEACHGPAGAHIDRNANPIHRYKGHWDDAHVDRSIVNPARLSADRSSQVCGQCHGIYRPLNPAEFATDGFAYKPGDDVHATREYLRHPDSVQRTGVPVPGPVDWSLMKKYFWSDGAVRVTGREFTAMSESACYLKGDLSCLSCHSMHTSDPVDQLAVRMDSDEACLSCHENYRNRVAAHSHHKTDSSGSRCYNCHMPHTAYGLLKGVRNHLIDSPTIAGVGEAGRPNACNLCHYDQTLSWTARYLKEWYGQKGSAPLSRDQRDIAAGLLWLLRGDGGQRALAAWHMRWADAREVSGATWTVPALSRLLDDPYPAVRYIAAQTIQRVQGWGDIDYDFLMDEDLRRAVAEKIANVWAAKPLDAEAMGRSELLMSSDGVPIDNKIDALYRERDDSLDYLSE